MQEPMPPQAPTPAPTPNLLEQMNGIWISDIFTVEINWETETAGTYEGVAYGQSFSTPIELIEIRGNVVEFRTNQAVIVAQIWQDGNMVLTRQGADRIPIQVRRAQ